MGHRGTGALQVNGYFIFQVCLMTTCLHRHRGAKGALLVYDITNKQSLESAREWLTEFRKYGDEDAIVMLIGNKSDLGHMRAVSTSEGKEFAQNEGLLFMEASALDSTNVRLAFLTLLNNITEYLIESSNIEDFEELEPDSSGTSITGPTYLRTASSLNVTTGSGVSLKNWKQPIDAKNKKECNC
jgi:GTPase SAR1 family protein